MERRWEIVEQLQKINLFNNLAREEIILIVDRSVFRFYEAGKVIFTEGEAGGSLYILLQGRVKVSKISPDGKEKILAIIEPGDFFGEMSLIDGRPRSAMAQTLTDTRLLAVGQEQLQQLFTRHPRIAIKMLAVLSGRLRETNRQLKEVVFYNTRDRLWHELNHLARESGRRVAGGFVLENKMTHRELGELIGASRETVTRLLSRLQEEGLLEIQNRQLLLKDDELDDVT
ncbi:MAG: Crp/Fnr family transcriptional regulator [Halanaerobium sp.]|nr:Crp/Fnr family transcriptional regulator [Halanaerobium sp.]